MGGRKDYEERRKKRIEIYNSLSVKAKQEAIRRSNSTANRILQMTPGQPILIGHHSEKKARRLHEQANYDIKKSIELDDKSNYYNNRAESVATSKAIYNDDPKAIEKLKDKLQRLENQRESIKSREHETWELQNIGATIRETKLRIERLEKLEQTEFPDTSFRGGTAIHNKEINRIQLFFDAIPDEDVRTELKQNGFHWSRNEGAWQRAFNQRTINVTNFLVRDVFNKESVSEQEEEEEME